MGIPHTGAPKPHGAEGHRTRNGVVAITGAAALVGVLVALSHAGDHDRSGYIDGRKVIDCDSEKGPRSNTYELGTFPVGSEPLHVGNMEVKSLPENKYRVAFKGGGSVDGDTKAPLPVKDNNGRNQYTISMAPNPEARSQSISILAKCVTPVK